MQHQKHSVISMFLCVSALHLGVCTAQVAPPVAAANATETTASTPAETTASRTMTAAEEAEALMSLNELHSPKTLRDFNSRTTVDLPLQFALRAEPALEELTLAKQKNSDLMFASNAASAAHMLYVVNAGVTNSFYSSTSHALIGASIAFDVLDSLFSAPTDRDIVMGQILRLKTPSLYLLSLKKPNPDVNAVDALKQHFGEATKVLADLDLQCEPQQVKNKTFFTGKQLPRGYYAPGNIHHRDYICGYPSPMEVGRFRQETEKRRVEAVIFPQSTSPSAYDEGSMATITLQDLSSTKGIKRILDAEDKRDEEDLPKLAYERIQGKLAPNWFAIYTIKSDDKKRHVVVAQGDQQVEMVVPELR